MPPTQAHRSVAVETPLGKDVLLFCRMIATEQLGRPFEYELELLSENEGIAFADILGGNVTVRLERQDGETRYFNGYCARFSQVGSHGHLAAYRASLRPWLWFLTRTADCRIFQAESVPDIVMAVFREHGFTDFDDRLSGTYQPREYCVQYRETDFNFVSRLMEQEGIYYFFAHENGKHTLVLCDSYSAHEPVPGTAEIPYFPPVGDRQSRDVEHVFDWSLCQEVQPGSYALDDFDFQSPKKALQAKSTIRREHAFAAFEMYDYPGDYTEYDAGEAYAKTRIEELQTGFELAHGKADTRALATGSLFTLTDHPRTDQNREYLVVATTIDVRSNELESGAGARAAGGGGDGIDFECRFRAFDPKPHAFRSRCITPRPVVHGPQTAIVVGKSGEEIWTDEHGRVKVKFHWDRHGKHDETASCWVRVAQIWAGNKWGSMHLPRIGQEVLIEFLEGDPDRPLVTGRVYNGTAVPPYELPQNATISTVKSNSSKGGQGFNELRFEDKKDEEQVFLHAQKDLDVRCLNDRKEFTGNDRHLTVEHDRFDEVKSNSHSSVTGDLFGKVDAEVNTTIGADRKTKVGASDHLDVASDLNIATGGDTNVKSGGNHSHEIGTKFSVGAGTDIHQKAGANVAVEGGANVHVKGGANVVIEAAAGLTLKVGGNFVSITPAGVDIQGVLVKINSGGAALSGSGCSPQAPAAPDAPTEPTAPTLPVEAEPGVVDEVAGESQGRASVAPSSTEVSPQAEALRSAAESGTPFCEECEKAAAAK